MAASRARAPSYERQAVGGAAGATETSARDQQRARDTARQERDKARYDEARSAARLRLIELQSRLAYELTELAAFRDGVRFPSMDSTRRASEIPKVEQATVSLRAEVDGLTPMVGDPEDVVDEQGWLPRDRREETWWRYRLDRERRVRELKERLPVLAVALEGTVDR